MVLAPHDSSFIKQYHDRVEKELEAYPEFPIQHIVTFGNMKDFKYFGLIIFKQH